MVDTFRKAVAAGIAIAIGGTIYMSCTNKIVGAVMFSVGLFCICSFGLNLFTGKIGYIIESKNKPNCFIIWLGNLTGCLIGGLSVRLAKPELKEAAEILVGKKLGLEWYKIIILGIFCGILMYIAVENYKINPSGFGKAIGIFLCVPTFILCGHEHSIADIFYFALGVSTWENLLKAVVFILLVSVSNGVGSIIFRYISKPLEKSSKA